MVQITPLVPADSLKEASVEKLRAAILSGELTPGSKLRIQGLCERFGFSATPLREALSRLVATGLVEAVDQKGFRVVPISPEDLQDIQRLRHVVEREALRLSIENGDVNWESDIVSALHVLQTFKGDESGAMPEGRPEYDMAHKRFHAALLAACKSPRLISLHNDLHDQIYRYRVVMRLKPRRREASAMDHQALAQMAISRNTQGALDALKLHIDMTERATRQLSVEQWATAIAELAQRPATG